jgi:hypothetical protein
MACIDVYYCRLYRHAAHEFAYSQGYWNPVKKRVSHNDQCLASSWMVYVSGSTTHHDRQ